MPTATHALRILGFHWQDCAPSLTLQQDGETRLLPLVPGQRWDFVLHGPRRCVGRGEPCPANRRLSAAGGGLCTACRVGARALATPARQDEVGQQALRELAEIPHVVYLALFGSGWLKVGVSGAHRVRQRLIDQGAMAGLVVAATDGVEARRLERRVAATGIQDVVRTQRKARLLAERPSRPQAERALMRAADGLLTAGVLSASAGDPLIYLAECYPGEGLGTLEPVHVPERFEPGTRIVGRVRGIFGGLALLDADAEAGTACAVDNSRLAGYMATFTSPPLAERVGSA